MVFGSVLNVTIFYGVSKLYASCGSFVCVVLKYDANYNDSKRVTSANSKQYGSLVIYVSKSASFTLYSIFKQNHILNRKGIFTYGSTYAIHVTVAIATLFS